jgi:micrococcal nuclease
MTRRSAPSLVLSSWLLLLLTLCPPLPAVATDTATLVRVVDGDTVEIELKGQTEKVQLIGINTPEKYESDKLHRDAARTGQDEATIQALGERASAFTKSLVQRGDTVQVEYDQQPRDKYQRLLAFVWLSDGRMLNETIVCEGYGNALTRYPVRQDYMARFRTCERHAREQGKGLWAEGYEAADRQDYSRLLP